MYYIYFTNSLSIPTVTCLLKPVDCFGLKYIQEIHLLKGYVYNKNNTY